MLRHLKSNIWPCGPPCCSENIAQEHIKCVDDCQDNLCICTLAVQLNSSLRYGLFCCSGSTLSVYFEVIMPIKSNEQLSLFTTSDLTLFLIVSLSLQPRTFQFSLRDKAHKQTCSLHFLLLYKLRERDNRPACPWFYKLTPRLSAIFHPILFFQAKTVLNQLPSFRPNNAEETCLVASFYARTSRQAHRLRIKQQQALLFSLLSFALSCQLLPRRLQLLACLRYYYPTLI